MNTKIWKEKSVTSPEENPSSRWKRTDPSSQFFFSFNFFLLLIHKSCIISEWSGHFKWHFQNYASYVVFVKLVRRRGINRLSTSSGNTGGAEPEIKWSVLLAWLEVPNADKDIWLNKFEPRLEEWPTILNMMDETVDVVVVIADPNVLSVTLAELIGLFLGRTKPQLRLFVESVSVSVM